MQPLASWLRRRELDAAAERAIAKVVLEAGMMAPPHRNGRRVDDPWKLRGIPIQRVPGGIGGAIKGSRPGDELD